MATFLSVDAFDDPADPPGYTAHSQRSVVPPGLDSLLSLFPALKRWAKFGRPSGAELSGISFHRAAPENDFSRALKIPTNRLITIS
jgi:hypothetical protein